MHKNKEVAVIAAKKEIKKKKCPVCKNEKNIATGFYKSSSPLFALDGCVPICIECVKDDVVNEDGTVNENKLKTMCQRLDKPFYLDELDSAFLQAKSEHGYLSDDEVAKYGRQIIGFYFKNINTLRQNKNRSFADSEKDGFSHKTYNVNAREKKERIANRYADITDMDDNGNIIDKNDKKLKSDIGDFKITDEIIELFGDGYSKSEYKKMFDKKEKLKVNYSLQTNLHQEALATYVRFKVKEEMATAEGNVEDAKKWYDAAQNAADKAKSDFYSRIDSPFRKWLCTIDPETDNAYDKKVKWREECVKIALEFGKNIINNVEPSAVFGKNKPIKNKPIKNKPIDKEEKKIYSAAKAMNIFVAQVKSAEIK